MPNLPAELPERRITDAIGWLDALLDAVVIMGADGLVREWNRSAEQMFGWSREEAIGAEFVEMVVPAHLRDAHRAGLRRYLETGEPRILGERLELPAMRSDGATIAVELTITTALGDPDNTEFFVGFMREVTALRAAEAKAELGERRLRAIVEHSPSVISILSSDGSWEVPSEVGMKLLGWPRDLVPDGGTFALVHPDDLEYVTAAFTEATSTRGGSFGPATYRIRAQDDSWHWFETTTHNMLDDPAVNGVVFHSRDVTESRETQRLALESAARLSAVIENLVAGVVVEDADRRIVVINKQFTDLFEIAERPEALVGRYCGILAEQSKHLFADPQYFLDSTSACLENRTQVIDLELPMAKGRVLQRDYIPVFVDNRYDGNVWIYRDITERRDMENRRESLLAAERDVRLAIEEQNLRLRELDQLKSDFVANLSHELRTLLTSIIGFTEMLSDGAAGPITGEQREYVGIVDRSSHRMLRLMDDMLLLSRLETRSIPVELASIDLFELLQEAHIDLKSSAIAVGIDLDFKAKDGPPVFGDRGKLRQVIDNLVNNALKFTPAGGKVRVEAVREENSWILTVSDNGMGIPAGDAEKVFEKFFRASNSDTKRTPGTGLGLSITRAIVEVHHGNISVASIEGSGTTFTVRLPDQAMR